MALPNELLDLVVLQLDPVVDRSSLYTLLLTSKACYDMASRRLYSRLVVTGASLCKLVSGLDWVTCDSATVLSASSRRILGLITRMDLEAPIRQVEYQQLWAAATALPSPMFPNVRQLRFKDAATVPRRIGSFEMPPPGTRFFAVPDVCVDSLESWKLMLRLPAERYGLITVHAQAHTILNHRRQTSLTDPVPDWDLLRIYDVFYSDFEESMIFPPSVKQWEQEPRLHNPIEIWFPRGEREERFLRRFEKRWKCKPGPESKVQMKWAASPAAMPIWCDICTMRWVWHNGREQWDLAAYEAKVAPDGYSSEETTWEWSDAEWSSEED